MIYRKKLVKKLYKKNVEIISKLISQQVTSDILLAWGGLFYSRAYFSELLKTALRKLKTVSYKLVKNWRAFKERTTSTPIICSV